MAHVVAERVSHNRYTIMKDDGEPIMFAVMLKYFTDAQGEVKAINPTHNEMWCRMWEYGR